MLFATQINHYHQAISIEGAYPPAAPFSSACMSPLAQTPHTSRHPHTHLQIYEALDNQKGLQHTEGEDKTVLYQSMLGMFDGQKS